MYHLIKRTRKILQRADKINFGETYMDKSTSAAVPKCFTLFLQVKRIILKLLVKF